MGQNVRIKLLQRLGCNLLAAGFAAAAGADEAAHLPEVLVEAPTAVSVADRLGQTSELDRASLEAGGKADLLSALRGVGGLEIGQSNASTTSRLVLRSAGGGLGQVTLDGVPLFNNFTGFFPLSHYPADLLENATVSRGFGGERFGSRTLGGSINLSSRQLGDGQAFLHTEGGSYGTVRNNLGGGIRNDWGNWTVAAGRTDIFEGVSQAGPDNGASERDNFHMSNALMHWNQDFGRGGWDSSLYFVRSREGMDGPGLLPSRKVGWVDDPRGLLVQETWVAQTHGHYKVSDTWDSSLRLGYTEDRQDGMAGNLLGRRFPMDLTSQLWLGHWENSHRVAINSDPHDAVRLVWGVDAQQQHANSPNHPAGIHSWTNTVASPLARIETEWGDWLASTEVRVDHYDQFGNHALFNAGSGWRLRPDMLLWAKGGTGYRAPAANERLHPLFGSPNLAPERSAGGEIGWRWQVDNRSELSLSGYFQRYDNLIILQQNSLTGLIRTVNASQANVWGSELQARHAWSDAWSSGLSYTYMTSRNPNTGLQIPARPDHQGQLWTEWRVAEPLRLRIDVTMRDGLWGDQLNLIRIKPAAHFNAQLDYQATAKLRLYLRGENLNHDRTPDLQGFGYPGAAVYGGFHADW